MQIVEYKSLIAFHPGYYITALMKELDMTAEDFSIKTEIDSKTVMLLLNGQISLNDDMARKVSEVFDVSSECLLNLQKSFDETIAQIEVEKEKDIKRKPDCPLVGQNGNIFNLMAIASKTLKENGMEKEAEEMCSRIRSSGDYYKALVIIGEYVNITSVYSEKSRTPLVDLIDDANSIKFNSNISSVGKEGLLLNMLNAVQSFRSAWGKCNEVFSDIRIDCNDYIVDGYPFDKSFDEIDVDEWCDKVIENISKDIHELKNSDREER